MIKNRTNIFEVVETSIGKYQVLVNEVAIATHQCREQAVAHCERLKNQDVISMAEQSSDEESIIKLTGT